ncbi:MAG: 3D domain-containing protein [Clostridia bacterium]|nr:3D domain-containing protein [Clostridia bacterium]
MNGLYVTYVKRALPLKQLALLFILSAFAITAGVLLYTNLSKDIEIFDNGKPIVVKTMGVNVKQALDRLGISVGQDDYLSKPLDSVLDTQAMNVITIKRAVPVNLRIDGQTRKVMSYRDTVEEVIRDNGIIVGPLDKFEGVSPKDTVKAGMDIRLIRIKEEILTEQEQIPFAVVEKPSKTMNDGETKTVLNGENGIREKYYKITYEDGKPIDRAFVNEKVVKNPVNKVVEYGTVLNFKNSRGELVRYSKVIKMKATAYTSSYVDTGKKPGDHGFGITYTGLKAREGVIAVDPKIIPLGTKVYIEVPGSTPDYGFAIAGDIGSAIKGNLIDLYFDSSSQVHNWGRRSVNVYILNEQSDGRWKLNENPCKK